MIGELISTVLPYVFSPGCQDIPPLQEDPNVLAGINKAARLWGADYPDVKEAKEAYYDGEGHGYKERVEQTHNCCNKCSHYRDRAEEQLVKIDSLIAPLLNSSQAGILGLGAGVKDVFTKPIYLIPICILLAVLFIFLLKR